MSLHIFLLIHINGKESIEYKKYLQKQEKRSSYNIVNLRQVLHLMQWNALFRSQAPLGRGAEADGI